MAQRGSQMNDSQGHIFGARSITPFKTPSHSLNISGSQAFVKDIFNGSGQVYNSYGASTNSSLHQSQPYDMSQAFSNNSDHFNAQKRNSISQMSTQDPAKNDNRVKFERFLKEIQGALSSQLDKVRDEIAKDLKNFKDVDSNIKRGLGLDVSSLSEEISCLKSDLKTAISAYSSKLESIAKEQSEEIQKVNSVLNQPRKNPKFAKGTSAKSLQDNLTSTFSFLKHEIADLGNQISLLKDQMKQDTQFAIDRITQVRDKYCADFSLNSQRQTLINEKFVSLLQQEKKRNQGSKLPKTQTEKTQREGHFSELKEYEPPIFNSIIEQTSKEPVEIVEPVRITLTAGNPMDIEKAPETTTPQVKRRGRPRRADSQVSLSENSVNNEESLCHELDKNKEEKPSLMLQLKPSGKIISAQESNSNNEESKNDSTSSIGCKPKKVRTWKVDDWKTPASPYKEFSNRFDYLRLSPEELERRLKLQKKKGKGKAIIQVQPTYSSIREERLAKRRASMKDVGREAENKSISTKKRTIINKEEHLAKETAIQEYGERSANVISQVSQIVKTAKKSVGKMRGRVNCSIPLTNS